MASFNPGWHDAAIGDVDGDGDIDIVTKIWNKDGATYHADYWRNDAIVRLDNGVDLAGWHSAGGLWQVGGGAIVGQQNPPGSGNGGLLLSDRSFGDFEVTFEVWPDWGVDTGLYTRTTADGKAYQVTIDYQAGNPQVHDSPAEWPKGAVARFRNIRIRDLSENSWAPDSLAPTAPSNLEITAVTASSVSLQWPASIDDVGVSGYRVFRNGVEAGTAVSTHFTDAGLASDAACIYTVRAFDA
ncbi:MAG: DUF1080 domain-containing protein, partial [Verrucomicrobia bacterium]|nr:DUF1080 domain-containing protein [Verrucomicrobiota bacterium]